MKLKIKVTKDVLERTKNDKGAVIDGVFCHGSTCAIAVAIIDIFPNAYVEKYCIRFDGRRKEPYTRLPPEASNFIDKFDTGDRTSLSPMEFQIEVPDAIIETINIDEIKILLQNHPTLELVS